jgi:hypothetical protein
MAVVVQSPIRWRAMTPWIVIPVFAFAEFSWLRLTPDASMTRGIAAAAVAATVPVALGFVVWARRDRKRAWPGFALLLALALPLSVASGLRGCRGCGSYQEFVDLGWGIGRDWIRIPLGRDTRPSRALRDFHGGDHLHDWGFCHRRYMGAYILNTVVSGGSIACGGDGYRNRFSNWYERDEGAPSLVAGRIAAGEVTADEVRRLSGLPRSHHRVASVPPGTHALVRKAGAWMGEPLWFTDDEADWPPER